MKIGLVIYGSLDTLSGGYLYDRMLVEYLRANGDSVEILSLPWRNYVAHLQDNLSFRLPAGLDLIIEDELNHPSLLAANRKPHKYPVLSLVHHLRSSEQRAGWQNAVYRVVERSYLGSVDGFIFNSETTRAVVQSLAGLERPGIVAYPPTDRFDPGLSPEAVISRAADPGPLRLLFLGSLIPRKGLHTLLEALSLLPQETVRLDVAGSLQADPGYVRTIQQRLGSGSLGSRVRLLGSLQSEQLAELLRTSQVLVVPSSYEGFGIAYLEGMAFGLPAIGTTAGGASEIITDKVSGWLIPPGDARMLAARLGPLAQDRSLLVRLSLGALLRYRQQPRWEETAASIRDFLQGFIS